MDVLAPGTDVIAAYSGGGYEYFSGTSMAVPLVTGIAALIYAYSDKYYDCKTLKLKVLESTKDDKYLPNAIASTGIISMEQAYENSIS